MRIICIALLLKLKGSESYYINNIKQYKLRKIESMSLKIVLILCLIALNVLNNPANAITNTPINNN